jgi:CBS domain containing-hemolysin-like protein
MTGQLLLTLLLVLMNGFFVAAEFAIVKVRASQLELQAKRGNRSAKMAKHIVTHLDGYLAATQLGITLASLGLGWIGEPVVSKMIISLMDSLGVQVSESTAHNIALPVAFAIITILHIVFGELAPKSIAIQRSEKTTLAISFPLQFFFLLFRPFIWVLNGIANLLLRIVGITTVHGSEVHSSEEMKYLVQQSQESGSIEKSEYDLIISAFDFSELTVKQILIPRLKVSGIDIDDPFETQLEKIIEDGYSRYPVYKGSMDNIIGVVYTKDVLLKLRKQEQILLKDLVRTPLFISEYMHIRRLLREFQRQHQQIAVIVDEYGNTQGIATMEDILEELVGEIQDEYDEEHSPVQKKDERTFLVYAQNSLLNINQRLPVPLETSDAYISLAGAIIDRLTRIPDKREKFELGAYIVTILHKEGNSIILVQLQRKEEKAE